MSFLPEKITILIKLIFRIPLNNIFQLQVYVCYLNLGYHRNKETKKIETLVTHHPLLALRLSMAAVETWVWLKRRVKQGHFRRALKNYNGRFCFSVK